MPRGPAGAVPCKAIGVVYHPLRHGAIVGGGAKANKQASFGLARLYLRGVIQHGVKVIRLVPLVVLPVRTLRLRARIRTVGAVFVEHGQVPGDQNHGTPDVV